MARPPAAARHRCTPFGENLPVVIFWYGGSWIADASRNIASLATPWQSGVSSRCLPTIGCIPGHFPLFDEDGARAVAWVEHHVREYRGDPHTSSSWTFGGGPHCRVSGLQSSVSSKFGADPKDIVGLVASRVPMCWYGAWSHACCIPAALHNQGLQPIKYVNSAAPPTLLLHGLADKEVSPLQAIKLRNALERAHVPVRLHLYAHRGHLDTLPPSLP